jgi:hypothetical protein
MLKFTSYRYLVSTSVADLHHFDADPNETYHLDAYPDADPDVYPEHDFYFMQILIFISFGLGSSFPK